MNRLEITTSATESLEEIRESLGMSQEKFTNCIFGMSLSSYKRMLKSETSKYADFLNVIRNVYRKTGKMAFQLLPEEEIYKDQMLRVVDKITRMARSSLSDIERYLDLCLKEEKDTFSDLEKINAMKTIELMYHKIIKVNLTDGTYVPIQIRDEEWKSGAKTITAWCKSAVEDELIYADDVEDFLAFTNVGNLRRLFKREDGYVRFRYRRRVKNEFHWVAMELVKCVEYRSDRQCVMLYVRDIQDDYV